MNRQATPSSGIKSLFSELRRRRVLSTAAIYLAATWLLLQVIATVFPIFELPEHYKRIATIGLFAGFPVVVIASWLFNFDLGRISRNNRISNDSETESTGNAVTSEEFESRMKQISSRTIAVMPFSNVGGNPDYEFFSDGIAEELINLLSKSGDLSVAARTSSFAFGHSKIDVQQAALRLRVRHVLEGSVRRDQDRVRIAVQLIDALSGFQLWSNSYDRQLTDIFAVQDEISSSIVYALSAAIDQTMGASSSLRASEPTESIEAYQLYLRGMYLWQRRGKTAIMAAKVVLTQALELDPEYADAVSLLAVTTAVLHEYSGENRLDALDQAEQLARRAMLLAPNASMPHAVRGYISMRSWQWEESETHFKKALQLDSSEPLVHQWYSNLLNDLGRPEKALVHALKAYQADRLSPQANNILALNFLLLKRNDDALKHTAVAREFGLGGAVPDWVEYMICLRNKHYAQATQIMTSSVGRAKRDDSWVKLTIDAVEDPAQCEVAVAQLIEVHKRGGVSPSLAVMQFILLGAADQAYAIADTQIDDFSLIHLWFFLPEATQMRKDSRFDSLMQRMGIAGYWAEHGAAAFL